MEAIYPFRWDITKREQLGRLVDLPDAEVEQLLDEWIVPEIRKYGAKIIALCDDSDLCFVGRSPEIFFDYLSGLLLDTSWADRLILLHYSRGWPYGLSSEEASKALREYHRYLSHLALDPESLARREHSVAFIDAVNWGSTFGDLIDIFHNWTHQIGGDWEAVKRKIRIVGITWQHETSPKTRRWQQHTEQASLLLPGAIKNVSAFGGFIQYMSFSILPRVSRSYYAQRWGDPTVRLPRHDEDTLHALKVAASLFDHGRRKQDRLAFARVMGEERGMRYKWFRDLVSELKR